MIDARLEALARRHAALDAALSAESASVYHDEVKIRTLKLEKLRLKDEMRALEQAANSNRQKWH